MLDVRVNTNKLSKTKETLSVESVKFLYFNEIKDDEGVSISSNKDKVLLTCECTEEYNLLQGSKIIATNTLTLNGETFYFVDDIYLSGVNEENRSFSFIIDQYYKLHIQQVSSQIITSKNEEGEEVNTERVNISFEKPHYFSEDEDVILYFRYINTNGEEKRENIFFQYYDETIVYSEETFSDDLKKLLLNSYYLLNVEVYRENFKFIGNCNFYFQVEKATVNIPLHFVTPFETDLQQSYMVQEKFVDEETNKAIGDIVDLEKDVYYPVIKDPITNTFTDVSKIKFNLHFREHRGDNWIADRNSFWNGVTQQFDDNGDVIEGTANINKNITKDEASDLLTYLGFNNNDVYYQKNVLKKSFLRLSYYDSTNVANQSLLDYSTVFLNSGTFFSKYVKYQDEDDYIMILPDDESYGKYTIQTKKDGNNYKIYEGIKVNREKADKYYQTTFEEKKRLSSQLEIEKKNTSTTSSEGFYFYIWKANESVVPQDIYMKIEFNHAQYGRTVPFMLPYWDKQKHEKKVGIKTFQEIVDDWNTIKNIDEKGNITWTYNGKTTGKDEEGNEFIYDGHYTIKEYLKFAYIHLKYQYDKDNNKHVYYLDTDTYGDNIKYTTDENGNKEIVINLFEAKVE